jgi:hypothetical protein
MEALWGKTRLNRLSLWAAFAELIAAAPDSRYQYNFSANCISRDVR